MIVGVDEVGRGSWAGPLVVGAVCLNDTDIPGLTDSKKLTKIKRDLLNDLILKSPAVVGLGWVDSVEVDSLGLSASLVEATKRAMKYIVVPYDTILIDGTVNFLRDTKLASCVTTMKKADLVVPSVSAASIVAKVARDTFMEQKDSVYPEFGFKHHKGYGTAMHVAALEAYGFTTLHRKSFKPLKNITKAYFPQGDS